MGQKLAHVSAARKAIILAEEQRNQGVGSFRLSKENRTLELHSSTDDVKRLYDHCTAIGIYMEGN